MLILDGTRMLEGPPGRGAEERMLRVTDDLVEVRRWTERHGGLPCRRLDGALGLCFGTDPSPAIAVGWDEFETNFVLARCVLVYDETPGSRRSFVGPASEARAFIQSLDPRLTGAAGDTP